MARIQITERISIEAAITASVNGNIHLRFRVHILKGGESRDYLYFSSIVESTLNFEFDHNVSYKQMLQLAVAVFEKFTGTMLYQDIIRCVWNIGVAARGCNMRNCFDDPNANVQDVLCAEVADNDSSGYPHMEWRGNFTLNRK